MFREKRESLSEAKQKEVPHGSPNEPLSYGDGSSNERFYQKVTERNSKENKNTPRTWRVSR